MLRRFERGFDKAAYPVVFLAPNNIVCLLAGASGMPIAAFVAVNLAGTLTRLYIIRALGRAFSSPIEPMYVDQSQNVAEYMPHDDGR